MQLQGPSWAGDPVAPSWLDNWRWPPLPEPNATASSPIVWPPQNVLEIEESRDIDPYLKALALGLALPTTESIFDFETFATTTASLVLTDPTTSGTMEENLLSDSRILFVLANVNVTATSALYASVILFITVLLISTSILTMAVILTNDSLRDVVGFYLVSLSVSDLISALDPHWRFGNKLTDATDTAYAGEHLCRVAAYLEIMTWTSVVYIFMWMCVDRYTALERPNRYEVEQSSTRCKCWIAFSWMSALLLACPILAAQMKAEYYDESYMCMLDWTTTTKAFSTTLACLVLVPTAVSVIYVYNHIFKSLRNPDDLEDNQKMLLETDPNFMVTFFIILSFTLCWLPWFVLKAYETLYADQTSLKPLHFTFIWLAVSSGCWKVFIYFVLNREFRRGFTNFCQILCCCCCGRRSPDEYGTIETRQRYFS